MGRYPMAAKIKIVKRHVCTDLLFLVMCECEDK